MSSLAGRSRFVAHPERLLVPSVRTRRRSVVATAMAAEASPFLEAAVLPAQLVGGSDLYSPWMPKLMFAILEDALRLAAWGEPQPWWTQGRREIYARNEAWFHDVTADGPFAIETVCDVLSLSYRTVMRVHARVAQADTLNPEQQRVRPVRPTPPASMAGSLRPRRGCGGMVITWMTRQT